MRRRRQYHYPSPFALNATSCGRFLARTDGWRWRRGLRLCQKCKARAKRLRKPLAQITGRDFGPWKLFV